MKMGEGRTTPLWWEAVDARVSRPALPGDLDCDVAIVGAGYTGLWTAYYLKEHDPGLNVVVIEKHHVGFGASGRNGGWCHAEYPLGVGVLVKEHGKDEAVRHMRALHESVDQIGRIAELEAIDCDFAKGGVLVVARSDVHMGRVRAEIDEARHLGFGEEDLRELSSEQARAMLNAAGVVGGTWHPHGAAIQPAKLVQGLAKACERRGVTIYEDSSVSEIAGKTVVTEHGRVTAGITVRATEGFTSDLAGLKRAMVPLYSLMVATEPLSDELWSEIGLADRPTFGDFRNLIIYGQRTADGRLAFGGRGAPYYFGSSTDPRNDIHDRVHAEIIRALGELLPQLSDVPITHRWGGALGAPRDWRPTVSIDRAAGMAWAGGYVGDGVNTAHLAGQTLADLITERATDLTTLPWVQHRWKSWEPEPLRFIGINAGLWMAKAADASEERTNRPSQWAAVGNWMRGKTR